MERPNRTTLAYCDIVLFPWDKNISRKERWLQACSSDFQIRIEVKWLQGNNLTPSKIFSRAGESAHTMPHFIIIVIFHGSQGFTRSGLPKLVDNLEVVANISKNRKNDIFERFPNLSLIVLRNKLI